MLKKVSGAKSVFVKINNLGRNFLPLVEDLRDRMIKYVDFVPVSSIPYSTATAYTGGGFLSLADVNGNFYPYYGIPMDRFDITQNLGRRPPVMRKISLPNSYIEVTDPSDVGKVVCLVFFYDLPQYSARNTVTDAIIDSAEVTINLSQARNVFPDLRTMAGKRFRHISFSAPTKTFSGQTGITLSEAGNVFISFVKGNYAVIDMLPLIEFYDIPQIEDLNFSNIVFDFTNSFVTVGGTQNLDGKTVMVNLSYESK